MSPLEPHLRAGTRRAAAWRMLVLVGLCFVVGLAPLGRSATPVHAQDGNAELRIVGSAPLTWDPALAGDASSASMLAQVFEGLTAFDSDSRVQPALAESWAVQADGRRITFQLRAGLRYSDGTLIDAQDVVDSWLRLLRPERPSPLVSLLADVDGALDYLAGRVGPDGVGMRAEGDQVIVEFRRPAAYFLAVTASPSLAVVPPAMGDMLAGPEPPADFVASGGYVPQATPATDVAGELRLIANPNYWAGPPPLSTIDVLTDLGGRSPVAVFEAGQVDYTDVASFDGSWIRYDPTLGPQLRRTDSFSIHYFGFDTTRAPFDDARVRLAFAHAVDWDRIVRLSRGVPAAGSIVPPGIPGRGEEDYRPAYDPDAARRLLAEAGFAEGEGFPAIPLISFGYGYEVTAADELQDVLGISVPVEIMEFSDYIALLEGDTPPRFWTLSWIADYPHPHAFLGLLLESGSASNYGGWSHPDYDAEIDAAAAAGDEAEQNLHYAAAQRILRAEAPVIPVEYGDSWALSRDGLLGALESGMGMIRYAGLDWAPGSAR